MASVGDIVFIGYNGLATTESFAFVVRNALTGGDVIKFTDNAISNTSANSFRTGEYAIQWTLPTAGVAAGTVVVITNWSNSSTISFNDGVGGSITNSTTVGTLSLGVESQTNGGLSNSGDQIFAYTGTLTSATILAGLDASSSSLLTTGTPNTNNTYAPLAGVPFTDLGQVNAKTIYTNPGAQTIANLTNSANFSTNTGNTGFTLTDIPITVSLSVSSNSGSEAGTTAITVTATASRAVSANETVNLAVSGTGITTGDYTLSNSTITIPSGQTTGTVTFTIVDDKVAEGTETATLTINSPSSGIALGTTTSQNITITDNDTAGVTITESGGSTNVTEGGATDTYTVVLTSQPTADVTIAINSGTQTTTSANTLIFTSANWNTAQTITVTAVDDNVAEGNHTQTITHTATSSDTKYNNISIASVTANITDNDTAGINVTPTSGLVTTEAGGTATFTVALNSQPTANVTINLTSSNTAEGTVSATPLTFTAANWNVAQTVTVTGVDDFVADGNIAYNINGAATSTDTNYANRTFTVGATNNDNDTAGVTITESGGSTNVTEGGSTDTYTVVLTSQPTANVTIAINSGTEATTNPTTLTFTSANWNTARTVTVTAVDDTVAQGNHTQTITHTATSSDTKYNNISIASVTANITDNDSNTYDITGSGRNNITGTSASERIFGGIGAKSIAGGGGNDVFIYTDLKQSGHTITDFNTDGSDIIDLTQLLDSILPVGYDRSYNNIVGNDKYVRLGAGTNGGTLLSIDRDGSTGSAIFKSFLQISNITPDIMNNPNNFLFSSTNIA